MTQKELALLLGLSEAAVSKCVKKGMPTESLEKAIKWRKRNLEPGRIKGTRFEPKSAQSSPVPQAASAPKAQPCVSVKVVEGEAAALNTALANGDQEAITTDLAHLRGLLRDMPDTAQPKFPLRVWLALMDYVLNENAAVRHAVDQKEPLTPAEFGKRLNPDGVWLAVHCLDDARDWRGFSITGFPEYHDHEEMMGL